MEAIDVCGNIKGYTYVYNREPGQKCPEGFIVSKTYCTRPPTKSGGCFSFTVPTHGINYGRVCMIVFSVQVGTPDGVSGSNRPGSIDEAYVDGVSMTHGKSPRKHIWTYMASSSEKKPICPCSTGSTVKVPDFIGKNYLCESANPDETAVPGKVYGKDVLWDRNVCRELEASCCENRHAYAVLPSSTTDDIEVRVCSDEATTDEDIGLLLLRVVVH